MSSKMFIHFFKYQKIMTSEKLAEFRVKGMLLDPKFDRLAVIGDKLQKKDEDKIKTLSIKFVSCSADDKNYYLTESEIKLIEPIFDELINEIRKILI